MKELPIKLLKESLIYKTDTGLLFWKKRPLHHFKDSHAMKAWSGRYSGCKAGGIYPCNGKNYRHVTISRNQMLAHRVIWALVTGEWPKEQIDHIDGNGLNNRFENLRVTDQAENLRNQRKREDNTSGHTGVHWDNNANKWQAQIKLPEKRKYLGIYSDWFEAVCVRKSAENKFGFHSNHGQCRPL